MSRAALTAFVAEQVTGYARSIEATLALSLAEPTPEELPLLRTLLFLVSDPVPMSMLSHEALAGATEGVETALADLDTSIRHQDN